MINDTRLWLNREQPLEVWVFDVIAVVNDVIYDISKRLNQILDEVLSDVC
ncbi:unnamed protein product [marine sediment metagenome]|uniref:Uncharacterized protein n=1 Tax=marine sediment metagenome TaxID=412755 RepID=X1H4S8_9ZZZZ